MVLLRLLVLLAFIQLLSFKSIAQQLYMPLEFKKAYQKNTRKTDGTVATGYWQNRSTYKLKAKVDPYKKLLTGEAKITYYNNSPDTLKRIVFHTYHDYYRAESDRAGFFAGADRPVTEGVIIDKLTINAKTRNVKTEENIYWAGTYYRVGLEEPLAPKASVSLEIDWHYTIPGKGFERSGAIDSTSMFIAYWYPEIAVYDDIDGWDQILYDAATEFYHDYADYEVEIQAPDNFIVWASVAPVNEAEIYSETIKKNLAKARKSTQPVSIISDADWKKGVSMKSNTWKFTASNFPDFSFALSNHFLWDAMMYKDNLGEYFLNVAYPLANKGFVTMLRAQAESIKKFHTEFPVYTFPFKHFTIFNGLQGGGMEFAGMANDEYISTELIEEYTGQKLSEEKVYAINMGLTLHEMGHMYFPFLMGINEKKYAWMDEGMAQYTENFMGTNPFDELFGIQDNNSLARQAIATPLMVPSYTHKNSGTNSYSIGSASYYSLSKLLGKATFDKCLKAYMDRWKYKHPTPYDFMFTFNNVSGQDLNWFWKAWYFDWGYMDMVLEDYKNNQLTIRNEGGRPIAFTIEYTFKDGKKSLQEVSPLVWKDKNTYQTSVQGEVSAIKLLTFKEVLISNNTWPR